MIATVRAMDSAAFIANESINQLRHHAVRGFFPQETWGESEHVPVQKCDPGMWGVEQAREMEYGIFCPNGNLGSNCLADRLGLKETYND